MDERPILNNNISIKDFKDFYWLKRELIIFCKKEGLITKGGKIEITERIEKYLKTGETQQNEISIKHQSKFNWNSEHISLETKITDNYKNTENVRKFFEEHIGKQFRFNVKFMNWMKSNSDKTMNDAIEEWKSIKIEMKNRVKPKKISPQFEYNIYLRDFMNDNPNSKRELGIKLWEKKKSMRGDNNYKKEVLN